MTAPLSESLLSEIRERKRTGSLVERGKFYGADVSSLLDELDRLRVVEALSEVERQELAKLRGLRAKVDLFFSDIFGGPTA